MARVTIAEVEEIIDTDLSDAQITAMISAANIIVTNGPATSTKPALNSDELKEIERWLAAHFVCIRDPVSLRAKIGDSDTWNFPASVTTAWGKGLLLTVYGSQAVAMDRSGKLANLGLQRGSFRASPRENSDNFTENLTSS
ncbi:hypothetical protein HY469_05850 [Candidatus Roizmanbacteria bacterium]|nr:hypothetical protein [Candidatus Roizmanbacteria bacterium]